MATMDENQWPLLAEPPPYYQIVGQILSHL
jgi:hypothetical protein